MIGYKTKSIRRYLLTSLVIALLGIFAVLTYTTYRGASAELTELYDDNLRQVALMIQSQHLADFYDTPKTIADFKHQPKKITREEDLFIRITTAKSDTTTDATGTKATGKNTAGNLRYISHSEVDLPLNRQEGFSTMRYQGKRWHFFVVYTKGDFIEVAQSIDLRQEAIAEVALSLIIPTLLFIPALGLFIWFAVGRSVRPLQKLSASIKGRKSRLLEPISQQNIPLEILPLVDAFNILLGRLSNMVGILRQFTSDAAHELRTPLTALKLQIALVERAKDDNERQQAIEQLKAGADRSITLVQQLLTLARMEPGAAGMAFEPVDLCQLMAHVVQSFALAAADKNIALELNAPMNASTEKSIFIAGNQEALCVMLNNLVDNAIRYTPAGGRVEATVRRVANAVELQIADTGLGIRPDERERIFDRFYRGAGHDALGSGLGLAIVKQIADQHGAVIVLDSNQGVGLKITITFNNTAA